MPKPRQISKDRILESYRLEDMIGKPCHVQIEDCWLNPGKVKNTYHADKSDILERWAAWFRLKDLPFTVVKNGRRDSAHIVVRTIVPGTAQFLFKLGE